jgi:ribose/xylose/arabinose/galactoside ABC-type transport system permease subunit
VAAFLVVGRLGTASAGISSGNLFLSLAAAVIGGVSLTGGQGTAMGMLGGLLVIAVLGNAMNLAAVPGNMISVVSGAIILLAVLIDAIRGARFRRDEA